MSREVIETDGEGEMRKWGEKRQKRREDVGFLKSELWESESQPSCFCPELIIDTVHPSFQQQCVSS